MSVRPRMQRRRVVWKFPAQAGDSLLRLTGAARMERDDDGMAGQACLLRGVCLGVPHFRHADYVRSQPQGGHNQFFL